MKRNFSSALVGNATYAASQFIMVVALARITSPAEVGRYALALAIVGPLFAFTGLKLRQVVVTDAAGQNTFGEFLAQRLCSSSLALVMLLPVVLAFPSRTALVVAAVASLKAVESLIDVMYGALQRQEQLQSIALSLILRGTGGAAVFVAIVIWTGRTEVAVLGLTVFTLMHVVITARRLLRLGLWVRPSFDWKTQAGLTRLAFPLGVSVAVGSLTVSVPRYFLEAYGGTAELGIFAALAYFLVVSGMIIASLGEATSPRLARYFLERQSRAFVQTLKKLVASGVALGLIGVVLGLTVGEPLLSILYGEQYAANVDVLVILLASLAVQNATVFFGTAVNAMRQFRVQVPINVVTLIVVLASSMIAVPAQGIVGAALAVLVGQLVSALLYGLMVWKVVLPALRTPGSPGTE